MQDSCRAGYSRWHSWITWMRTCQMSRAASWAVSWTWSSMSLMGRRRCNTQWTSTRRSIAYSISWWMCGWRLHVNWCTRIWRWNCCIVWPLNWWWHLYLRGRRRWQIWRSSRWNKSISCSWSYRRNCCSRISWWHMSWRSTTWWRRPIRSSNINYCCATNGTLSRWMSNCSCIPFSFWRGLIWSTSSCLNWVVKLF